MAESLPTLDPQCAPLVLDALDEVVHVYMGGAREMRRKILGRPEDVGVHHENNIEHQWSVAMAIKTLHHNRDVLGIGFDSDFDVRFAMEYGLVHDLGETNSPTGDVDAMNNDPDIQDAKKLNEKAQFRMLGETTKYLGWVASTGEQAIEKVRPETKFGSDVDRLLSPRVILHSAPYRWLGANGEITTRERHDTMIIGKLQTPFGLTLYEEMCRDFDRREAERREAGLHPLFAPTENYGKFFQQSEMHKMLMGHKIWTPGEITVDWLPVPSESTS